jgi:Ni/Fe-hydrogenase subunit HybB-like protein
VVIPLVILSMPRFNKKIGWVVAAAVSVVIGVFFERYYLVIPGAAYPMHYYPGEIQGVWGATGSFPLTPAEMVLSVGIVAFLVFIFIMGLKYLELLPPAGPVKEAVKEVEEAAPESGEETEKEVEREAEPADDTAETGEGQQGNDEQ